MVEEGEYEADLFRDEAIFLVLVKKFCYIGFAKSINSSDSVGVLDSLISVDIDASWGGGHVYHA